MVVYWLDLFHQKFANFISILITQLNSLENDVYNKQEKNNRSFTTNGKYFVCLFKTIKLSN